jgi:hypothetical protein
MKIAICFSGQPRNYETGKLVIDNLIKLNSNCEFDFFYHLWHSTLDGIYYKPSTYRNIDSAQLLIKQETPDIINTYYKPKKYIIENPIIFETDYIKNSLMGKTLSQIEINNIDNAMSNIYSKYKSSLTLKNYVDENNVHYDFVLQIRFDFVNNINLNFNNLDKNKIYTACMSRKYINDNIVIANYENFLLYSKSYENINEIINNENIKEKSFNFIGCFGFVPEILLTCNLIYYDLYDKIETNNGDIPNFI